MQYNQYQGQVGLLSLHGRWIEYWPVWLDGR